MLDKLLGIATGASLADLGALAAITAIIVEVLKKILPQSFPTQALTIIVSIIVTFAASILCYGFTLKIAGLGIIGGFVVAFVAMNGFDSLRNIWLRFTTKSIISSEEEFGKENYIEEDDGGEG